MERVPIPSQGPTTPSRTSGNFFRYALTSVGLASAVILPLLRQGNFRSWRTVQAEDGFIFFEQAKRHGALRELFRGYAGYLQLPPRLLGAFSTVFPVRSLALYCAFSAT